MRGRERVLDRRWTLDSDADLATRMNRAADDGKRRKEALHRGEDARREEERGGGSGSR